jgi:hypothetical protein
MVLKYGDAKVVAGGWWLPQVQPMKNAERTAIRMIRRYGACETAIQQAHAFDVEAFTDEVRAFWRAVLAELRLYGVSKAD